ncbi:glycosyltransferase family 2 protein [Xanthovirga aplysinae]|uniref:glycosyltransferase family 2 protein n=1 Tax=Xanthovirga aplysinae TaxID=2529853 RepID=UPI0012BD03EC|nr:glycosyltransferase family 2 protein [Xanthovirga aplysinae]MTI32488.1 glycosyltransferase family 2 protein [Xanthovirga aplysinae]
MNIVKKKSIVSIIIPVFNRVNLVSETLNSVLDQSYQHWETIIVDDGSTDGTQDLIKTFVEKDQRFHFYQRDRKPKGGSVCRNIGLEKANGDYVIFLDSDDLLAPFCLQERMAVMRQNPDLDFAVFNMESFNYEIGDIGKLFNTYTRENPLYRFLRHDIPWQTTCPIWDKTFLIKLGGFIETFPRLQDPELHTRALMIEGVKYKIVDYKADCFFRINYKNLPNRELVLRSNLGFCLYIEMVLTEMEKLNRSDTSSIKKNLRRLFLFAFRDLAIYRGDGMKKEALAILKVAKSTKLLSTTEAYIFRFLLLLTQMKFHKVRGFGRLMSFINYSNLS